MDSTMYTRECGATVRGLQQRRPAVHAGGVGVGAGAQQRGAGGDVTGARRPRERGRAVLVARVGPRARRQQPRHHAAVPPPRRPH